MSTKMPTPPPTDQRRPLPPPPPPDAPCCYEPRIKRAVDTDRLAHEIAYSASRTDIECMTACAGGGPDKGGWWWRVDRVAVKDDRQWVELAVRYLDAVGLLERDSNNPHRVRIRGS